jgi:proline dehydrogenase
MTQALEENLARFSAESSVGADAIRLALFKTSVAILLEEVARDYEAEAVHAHREKARQMTELRRLAQRYREPSVQEVRTVAERLRRFGQQCRDMRRMMSGLELTRIMCKIEPSNFDGDHAGLDEIVNRLANAQSSLSESFDKILNSASNILSRSDDVQRSACAPGRKVEPAA